MSLLYYTELFFNMLMLLNLILTISFLLKNAGKVDILGKTAFVYVTRKRNR